MFSIIIISCLGILVYSNTFHCSFHLDDIPSIVEDFYIRDIHNLQNIWVILPRRFILYYTIALNYHFGGLHVFGYHLVNLTVHLISAVLVWWLTLLTLSTPAMKDPAYGKTGEKITGHANIIALFAGLIFVAHPIQTEAVTYIIQRTASMAALFYVASLCFYIKSRLHQDQGTDRWPFYYAASLVTAILAMFTKETAITLPLIIVLYEFCFLKTNKSFNWRYLTPFLFTILIIPLTIVLTEAGAARFQHLRNEPGISSMHYLLTQFRVMVTYIRLVFLPINQNLDYDYPVSKSILEIPTLVSFLFLISILFLAKHLFSKHKLIAFSILWFFLTLLPESSVLPIKDVIFEHRLYLPLVGYSIFLVSGTYYLFGEKNLRAMVIFLTIVTVCYAVLTYQRNEVWKNEFVLWDDTVQKSPHKARPYNNLGVAYAQRGMTAQSLVLIKKAVEIDPKFVEAYYNLGVFYQLQGDVKDAITYCTKTVEINPGFAKAYYNRGVIYDHQGKFPQAITDYTKSISIDPTDADAYVNRGLIYAKEGRLREAFLDFSKTVTLKPKSDVAQNNLGIIYASRGYLDLALAHFDQSIAVNPEYAEAYWNRAIAYYHLRKYNKAWADVYKAKELGYIFNPKFINDLKQASNNIK